ncbi:hypothetical protein BC831DRAFT_458738 [Entophlyctis helioformis]|nr:hypothetical protein BC831DRAFT_458738 [Entophlyctis helioformis]
MTLRRAHSMNASVVRDTQAAAGSSTGAVARTIKTQKQTQQPQEQQPREQQQAATVPPQPLRFSLPFGLGIGLGLGLGRTTAPPPQAASHTHEHDQARDLELLPFPPMAASIDVDVVPNAAPLAGGNTTTTTTTTTHDDESSDVLAALRSPAVESVTLDDLAALRSPLAGSRTSVRLSKSVMQLAIETGTPTMAPMPSTDSSDSINSVLEGTLGRKIRFDHRGSITSIATNVNADLDPSVAVAADPLGDAAAINSNIIRSSSPNNTSANADVDLDDNTADGLDEEVLSHVSDNEPDSVVSAEGDPGAYVTVFDYAPLKPNEIALQLGDMVYVHMTFHDGWCLGENYSTGLKGMVPLHSLIKVARELEEELLAKMRRAQAFMAALAAATQGKSLAELAASRADGSRVPPSVVTAVIDGPRQSNGPKSRVSDLILSPHPALEGEIHYSLGDQGVSTYVVSMKDLRRVSIEYVPHSLEIRGWEYRDRSMPAPTFFFVWRHAADKVSISGTFNNWERQVPMFFDNSSSMYSAFVEGDGLKHGDICEYKFLVDGKWVCDDELPIVIDETGHKNNFLVVCTQFAYGRNLFIETRAIQYLAPLLLTSSPLRPSDPLWSDLIADVFDGSEIYAIVAQLLDEYRLRDKLVHAKLVTAQAEEPLSVVSKEIPSPIRPVVVPHIATASAVEVSAAALVEIDEVALDAPLFGMLVPHIVTGSAVAAIADKVHTVETAAVQEPVIGTLVPSVVKASQTTITYGAVHHVQTVTTASPLVAMTPASMASQASWRTSAVPAATDSASKSNSSDVDSSKTEVKTDSAVFVESAEAADWESIQLSPVRSRAPVSIEAAAAPAPTASVVVPRPTYFATATVPHAATATTTSRRHRQRTESESFDAGLEHDVGKSPFSAEEKIDMRIPHVITTILFFSLVALFTYELVNQTTSAIIDLVTPIVIAASAFARPLSRFAFLTVTLGLIVLAYMSVFSVSEAATERILRKKSRKARKSAYATMMAKRFVDPASHYTTL